LRGVDLRSGLLDFGEFGLGIGGAHGHSLDVGVRARDSQLGLQHAGLGGVECARLISTVALGLDEFLLIGVQRAGGSVGVGFRGVVTAVWRFRLFPSTEDSEQGRLARVVRWRGSFRYWPGKSKIRGLRLFVGAGARIRSACEPASCA